MIVRKVIGVILAAVGFAICGFGLSVFWKLIYYISTNQYTIGPGYHGIAFGLIWGTIYIAIGLIPLSLGMVLLTSPKAILGNIKLSKKRILIICATLIAASFFVGLNTKFSITKEDAATFQGYNALRLYSYTIGESMATFERSTTGRYSITEPPISSKTTGLYFLWRIEKYKHQFLIATFLIGLALFMMVRER